jgi:uncharacterized protein (TIGR03066 family)
VECRGGNLYKKEKTMKHAMVIVSAVLLVLSASIAGACDEKGKVNKEKIVGTWYSIDEKYKDYPIEFTKDGKVMIFLKSFTAYGTYKVNDDELIMVITWIKGRESTSKLTIKRLTDSDLILENKETKESAAFRKKK